ncbi:hypothetical protein C3O72_22545 [Cronobacter sakazakii]|nr:hypothetical protein C3O72_22545 [Cronobacter sakazakii]
MARVSISEAARLVSVSRPTIYKLLKSGELSYTSVVKYGKTVKTIDTAELMRVFGTLGAGGERKGDTVKFDGPRKRRLFGVTALFFYARISGNPGRPRK